MVLYSENGEAFFDLCNYFDDFTGFSFEIAYSGSHLYLQLNSYDGDVSVNIDTTVPAPESESSTNAPSTNSPSTSSCI